MSLFGSGIRDWRIQRFTALFLAIYVLFITIFLFSHEISYSDWQSLFVEPWMQIGTVFALICTALHAWIGLWTVLTDYLKSTTIRYCVQSLILLTLFSYVIWGVMILWG